MMEELNGLKESPKKENILIKGGGTKTTAGIKLRSPAYAQFEAFDLEESRHTDEEAHTDEFSELVDDYNNLIGSFKEEKVVQGTITEVRENDVIVDVGFKSEGAIPISEFRDQIEIKVGDSIDVFLEKLENQDGLVVLSKEKADFFRVWDEIKESHDTARIMQGTVARRIKGGLVVDLLGVDAFLPGSQIALRQVPNLDELIGKQLDFKIIKINRRRRNIVVSRRVVLEEEREEQKSKLLAELEVGEIREGVVKNITDFGAFVDLGGVDGLLHLTDMTWGRISHPSEVVAIGNTLKVKILDFDKEREKISLGLKQLTPYPWDGVDERYPVNSKVRGKVVSITDYGAFVELEKGVEGLIHISEMSWTRHVKHPSKVLAIGEMVDAIVLKVDKDNQKISLGLKQVEPDPWSTIEEKYPIGTRLHGKVRNLTNFGAFVEIEDGIDGLLHISDMSWAKRIRHPSEVVKKSDRIEVVVLDISQDKKRISLGMKQLTENPWDKLAEEFAPDTVVEGTITRILERGAVVELRSDVEGFVPIGQMGKDDLKHPEDFYSVGDVLPLRVIKIDPKNKRIVLSITMYLKSLDPESVEEFHNRFPKKQRAHAEARVSQEEEALAGSGESSPNTAVDSGDEATSLESIDEEESFENEAEAGAESHDAIQDATSDKEDESGQSGDAPEESKKE